MRPMVFNITDGETTIELIKQPDGLGFHLQSWRPNIAEMKGGGVWKNSALGDGRKLALRRWDNVIETLEMTVNGGTQDEVIFETQELRRLLEKARDFWLPQSFTGPVWIVAQSDCETNERFALIHDYRTPSDDDPYSSNFSSPLPFFDNFALYLERGHWMDHEPFDSDCQLITQALTGYSFGVELVLNNSFETAGGGGADVFTSWTETAATGTIARDLVVFYTGIASAKLTSGGAMSTLVSQNIAVTAGSTYSFAFWYYLSHANDPGGYRVVDNTSGLDIIPLTVLPEQAALTWSAFSTLFTAPAGCVSAALQLWGPTTVVHYVNYDRVQSRLLGALSSFGVNTPTCSNGVFVSNNGRQAQLTNVYSFDTSAGTFSANLLISALPTNLLPNPVAAGDFLYLGIADTSPYFGPFSNVVFDLVQAAAGTITGQWEYWNGAAWVIIPFVQDFTKSGSLGPLSNTGISYINFEHPSFWTQTTVNTIPGFWIRLNVLTIASGAPRPQQQNRRMYSANKPWVDFDSNTLPKGDIPALLDVRILTDEAGGDDPSGIVVATRSTERGDRFNPYINLSDVQQPYEITVDPSGTDLNFAYHKFSPTGRSLTFSGAALPYTRSIGVTIAQPLAAHYYGTFRLFMRFTLTIGGLEVGGSMSAVSEITFPTFVPFDTGANSISWADFGIIRIPTSEVRPGQDISEISFVISIEATAGGTGASFHDLVLIPIDEAVVSTDGTPNSNIYTSVIEGSFPKSQARSYAELTSTGEIAGMFNSVSPTGYHARANKEMRAYVFGTGESFFVPSVKGTHPAQLFRPQYYAVSRYLSMRGSR